MKILVVGGRGFLGSVICNMMCEKHDVTSIDLGWFPTILNSKVEDIKDNAFNINDLKGYDSIIYVAGISNDPVADINPCETFANNVGLTFHLAKIAKRDKVKSFIYASSCSVYGWKNKTVTEDDVPETESYYGISKLLGERIAILSSKEFNVVIFRMGTLSGTSPRMRYDLLFNSMYASFKRSGKIIVNSPNIWRPVLHVKEAAEIYAIAAENNFFTGIYNLAGFNCTILTAAQEMQKSFGGEILVKNEKDIRNYMVDTSKIRKVVEIKSTIKDIILDLKENSLDVDVDNSIYYNIKTYEKIIKNVKC